MTTAIIYIATAIVSFTIMAICIILYLKKDCGVLCFASAVCFGVMITAAFLGFNFYTTYQF
ncbi:MAG: hypothetical protein FWB93_03375 [Oscillospiraceae bacterium]|nr:hypothetical protein [Oscillospiraceae bacterium]